MTIHANRRHKHITSDDEMSNTMTLRLETKIALFEAQRVYLKIMRMKGAGYVGTANP